MLLVEENVKGNAIFKTLISNAKIAGANEINDPDPNVSVYPSLKENAFSVRCIRD